MTQIIISDLEANLELDRQALSSVLGGKNGGWFKPHSRRNRRSGHGFKKEYYKEYYREYYSSNYYDKQHCYTPKFDYYGCYC